MLRFLRPPQHKVPAAANGSAMKVASPWFRYRTVVANWKPEDPSQPSMQRDEIVIVQDDLSKKSPGDSVKVRSQMHRIEMMTHSPYRCCCFGVRALNSTSKGPCQ